MHWAKRTVEPAAFSLGTSGVPSPPPDVFTPPAVAEPFTSATNEFGLPALKEVIARRHGVTAEHVLLSDGTSLANFAVLFTLAAAGDRVLVETPTYASIATIPTLLGAKVERWKRRPEDDWQPRLDDLDALLSAGPPLRLVSLSRLHNPTGADLTPSFLEGLAERAERHDFFVHFDEVYLDFVPNATPAHRHSPRFLSTGSLTKAWGFGGLRVGWVIADPDTLASIREASYYLSVNGTQWAQQVAISVFEHAEPLLARGRRIAAEGLAEVEAFLATRPDLAWRRPDGGASGFVRAPAGLDTAEFASRLASEHGVAIAAGDDFGWPGWLRVSFAAPADQVREALCRVGRALDAEASR